MHNLMIKITNVFHNESTLLCRQDLNGVDAIYVAGGLKHVGAGANLAFAVIPASVGTLRHGVEITMISPSPTF
jgi:hypothetical protein